MQSSFPMASVDIGLDTSTDVELVYVGPSLLSGEMDLRVLAEALGGFATLTERASSILYGQTYQHKAILNAPARRSSVIIPINLVSSLQSIALDAEHVLLSPAVQALGTLASLLGIGVVAIGSSLFSVFRERQGRSIDPASDARLTRLDVDIEVVRYVRLYNDEEVRSSIRRTLRPLREEGIDEFQTRRNGRIIERVTKQDLLAADAAEIAEVSGEEEMWLDIQKVALVRHLAWHFADGSATFDAKIEDERLWERVEGGERFGFGDRLNVVLQTRAWRDKNGRLHVERTIREVLAVEHRSTWSEPPLFDDGGS